MVFLTRWKDEGSYLNEDIVCSSAAKLMKVDLALLLNLKSELIAYFEEDTEYIAFKFFCFQESLLNLSALEKNWTVLAPFDEAVSNFLQKSLSQRDKQEDLRALAK